MRQIFLFLSITIVTLFNIAYANDAEIIKSVKKLGLTATSIKDSPISQLKTVITDVGIFYVSTDGKYILQAPLFDMSQNIPINITNRLLADKLNNLKKEMIVYKAAHEKYVVTVFTDISCGYCVKLHNEIAKYNEQGITIRYLAFPRAGMDSPISKKMTSIWCSIDRNGAYNKASKGEDITPTKCNIDLTNHYQLGVLFGVRGTPALLVEDTLLPGYQDAKTLRKTLDDYYEMKK